MAVTFTFTDVEITPSTINVAQLQDEFDIAIPNCDIAYQNSTTETLVIVAPNGTTEAAVLVVVDAHSAAALTVSEIPENYDYNGGTSTGSGNTYTVALTPVPDSLEVGLSVTWKADKTNTGAVQLDITGLSSELVRNQNGEGFLGGEIVSGRMFRAIYDGTDFILTQQDEEIRLKGSDWVQARNNAGTALDDLFKYNENDELEFGKTIVFTEGADRGLRMFADTDKLRLSGGSAFSSNNGAGLDLAGDTDGGGVDLFTSSASGASLNLYVNSTNGAINFYGDSGELGWQIDSALNLNPQGTSGTRYIGNTSSPNLLHTVAANRHTCANTEVYYGCTSAHDIRFLQSNSTTLEISGNDFLPATAAISDLGSSSYPFAYAYSRNFLGSGASTVFGTSDTNHAIIATGGVHRYYFDQNTGQMIPSTASMPLGHGSAPFTTIYANTLDSATWTNLLLNCNASGVIYFQHGGTNQWECGANALAPYATDSEDLGDSGGRIDFAYIREIEQCDVINSHTAGHLTLNTWNAMYIHYDDALAWTISGTSFLKSSTAVDFGTIGGNNTAINLTQNGTICWVVNTSRNFVPNGSRTLGESTNAINNIYTETLTSPDSDDLLIVAATDLTVRAANGSGNDLFLEGSWIYFGNAGDGTNGPWQMQLGATYDPLVPRVTNATDIGSSSLRVRQIYSNNSVDTSDIRVKTDMLDFNSDESLSVINNLRPFNYRHILGYDDGEKRLRAGFSAQELIDEIPEAVFVGDSKSEKYTDGLELWGVDSTQIIPYLVSAVQELSKQLEELRNAN